jgi:hypothetical protein
MDADITLEDWVGIIEERASQYDYDERDDALRILEAIILRSREIGVLEAELRVEAALAQQRGEVH